MITRNVMNFNYGFNVLLLRFFFRNHRRLLLTTRTNSINLIISIVTTTRVDRHLLPIRHRHITLCGKQISLQRIQNSHRNRTTRGINSSTRNVRIRHRVTISKLIIRRRKSNRLDILTTIFTTITMMINRYSLLIHMNKCPARGVRGKSFYGNIAISLRRLPNLINIVRCRRSLSVYLATTLVTIRDRNLTLFISTRRRMDFRLQTLLPNLTIVNGFLRFIKDYSSFTTGFIETNKMLPIFPRIRNRATTSRRTRRRRRRRRDLRNVFFIGALFLAMFRSIAE